MQVGRLFINPCMFDVHRKLNQTYPREKRETGFAKRELVHLLSRDQLSNLNLCIVSVRLLLLGGLELALIA